jgi:hypothetical protein
MNLDEFDKKAYEWGRIIENVLIEITRLKDAKGMAFMTNTTPMVIACESLISEARVAIKRSELSLKLEDDT